MNSRLVDIPENQRVLAPADVNSEQLTLQDPRAVLSLLEADQVVAAKRRTHFGKRHLSFSTRVLLWALRIYVVAMFIIVLLSVLRAIHAMH